MKKIWKITRFFNLIEVSLALGVTAVGVMGAIAILPIAMKTSSSTTYSSYLSDATGMIFMEIDNILNENCYYYKYDEEQKNLDDPAKLSEIQEERKEQFADIMGDNEKAAVYLNEEMKISSGSGNSTGVYVLQEAVRGANHGIIAFYPDSRQAPGSLTAPDSDYTQNYTARINKPLFSARYRIVVTNLENDNEYKLDGLRKMVEVETKETVLVSIDPRTGKKIEQKIPGVRVAGAQRCDLTNNEKKLMKRVYIELSWPITAKYASRTKKTFIREYYMVD